MKIGIDARTLSVNGGSKTYASNLLLNIKKRENITLFGIDKFENYKCINEKLNQQSPFYRLYYDNLKLSRLLKKQKITIFHGLKGIAPKLKHIKIIITVHDTIFLVYPQFGTLKELIYWKYISPKDINKADHIIAISNSTKKDLIERLRIHPKNITVIHESYNSNLYKIRKSSYKNINKFLKQKGIDIKDKKIILNVNTISPRKNISGLIKAFNLIAKKNPNLILIISGRDGWKTKKTYEEYNKSYFKNRIYFLGFTPEKIVADLYNIARVFVYPSFYEGFGLPILEAQACGCPVITSNVSSMPEVAGSSGILINPNNVNEIADAIFKVISNKKFRYKLIKKGYENLKRFSWKKCAEETLKVYEEVHNEK